MFVHPKIDLSAPNFKVLYTDATVPTVTLTNFYQPFYDVATGALYQVPTGKKAVVVAIGLKDNFVYDTNATARLFTLNLTSGTNQSYSSTAPTSELLIPTNLQAGSGEIVRLYTPANLAGVQDFTGKVLWCPSHNGKRSSIAAGRYPHVYSFSFQGLAAGIQRLPGVMLLLQEQPA